MPSVAMKLLTFSLTTKNPLMKPAIAQAPRAMNIAARSGVLSVLDRYAEMTSAIDMLAPIARS